MIARTVQRFGLFVDPSNRTLIPIYIESEDVDTHHTRYIMIKGYAMRHCMVF